VVQIITHLRMIKESVGCEVLRAAGWILGFPLHKFFLALGKNKSPKNMLWNEVFGMGDRPTKFLYL
jgi:hypothetical protein